MTTVGYWLLAFSAIVYSEVVIEWWFEKNLKDEWVHKMPWYW